MVLDLRLLPLKMTVIPSEAISSGGTHLVFVLV